MRRIPTLAALFAVGACQQQPSAEQPKEATAEAESGPGVSRGQAGKPAPDVTFRTPDGDDTTIADFAGKPVLVNLWASWCVPCVKELPTLEKLRDSRDDVAVIAISQDMGPAPSVAAFLGKHGVGDFAAYQDSKMALSGALGAQILPTTVLYDAEGREVWRYVGDLDWTGADAAKLLAELPGAGAAR